MADITGGAVGCNDRCGCPVPCPGGAACSTTRETSSGGKGEHNKCSCGAHCGCNPCTCPGAVVTAEVGKEHCKCGDGCTCVPCNA